MASRSGSSCSDTGYAREHCQGIHRDDCSDAAHAVKALVHRLLQSVTCSGASHKFQASSCKFQATSFKLQAASSKQQVSSCKLQVPSGKFQALGYEGRFGCFRWEGRSAPRRKKVASGKLQVPRAEWEGWCSWLVAWDLGLGRIWRNAASGVIGWLRRGPFGCVAEDLEPGRAVRAVEQGFAQVFERLGVGDALE